MDLAMPYGIVEQTVATSATANHGIFDFCTVILHFVFFHSAWFDFAHHRSLRTSF
jgi:hypothetical protein